MEDALLLEKEIKKEHGRKATLVAGGAGFLGSHLVDQLIQDGHKVLVLDSLQTGLAENLRHLDQNPNFKLIRHDIREPLTDVTESVSQIYHLACPASPPQYQKDPVKTLDTCYKGTKNLLDFASRRKARIMLASTSEVYGDPLIQPQSEDYYGNVNPFGPRSCYDEGKRVAESLCWAYQHHHNLDLRIARIFNVYGPRMGANDGRVVSSFIAAAKAGENIKIFGDGSATRSFQYVDDCVRGLTKLMDSDYDGGPMNIGNDKGEVSVADLATMIQNLVAHSSLSSHNVTGRSKVEILSRTTNDPVNRKPDITLARKVLKWHPVVTLEEGLKKTIEWFPDPDTSLDRAGGPKNDANGVSNGISNGISNDVPNGESSTGGD